MKSLPKGCDIDRLRHLLEPFSAAYTTSLRARRMSSLRGRLHRYAMETCSARIDLHTVFALVPCAISLKKALKIRVQAPWMRRSGIHALLAFPSVVSGNQLKQLRILTHLRRSPCRLSARWLLRGKLLRKFVWGIPCLLKRCSKREIVWASYSLSHPAALF